jgi:hypothetical protein
MKILRKTDLYYKNYQKNENKPLNITNKKTPESFCDTGVID